MHKTVIKLILIFFIISISNQLFSKETKFEKRVKKDIDKLSKVSGFIDNELKLYDEETILDKKNTIIIMYNHGSWKPETRREECVKGAGRIPEVISSLHNKKINNMTIRIYRMCSGVRGLGDHHFDRVHKLFVDEGNPNGFIDLIDYDGIKLYDKVQQHLRRQVVIDTIDNLIEKGYDNIILSGLSAGGFLSFYLTAHFPDKINGSIIFNPAAFQGKLSKNAYPPRQVLRDNWEKEMSKFSEINSLVFIHDDDGLEDSKTLSFLTQMNKVQTINYTDFGCEFPLGGKYKAHIFPVYPEKDSCFTKWEKKNNYIEDYLNEIFN